MYKKNIAPILSLAVLLLPTIVYGAGLIPCEGTAADPCTFDKLIVLANSVVHFLMYSVAVPLAAIGFMWAGGRLVLLQDKEGEWNKAKESFGNIAMGFAIMIGAYVLIKTILFSILRPGSGYTLFILN